MDKPSLIVWGLVGVAIFAAIAILWLFIRDLVDERAREQRLAAMDPDITMDAHLARLEVELETLKSQFQQSGLADYPGGPMTVADDRGHGNQRPVRPSKR